MPDAGSSASASGVLPDGAVGLLETHGLVAAIEAADAMLKAADVRLLQQTRTVPALVTHVVTGETAAVRAAVDAGARAAERVGRVAGRLVIPRPADGLGALLAPPRSRAATDDRYTAMTVRDLRALARERDDDEFSGRTISAASKDDLVTFLRADDASADGGPNGEAS